MSANGDLRSGVPFATRLQQRADEEEVEGVLRSASTQPLGGVAARWVADEAFDQAVTVGYMHVLKLAAWWTDSARATTAVQPRRAATGSAARRSSASDFGGRGLGALEASTAYACGDLLTVESNDVDGPDQGLQEHRRGPTRSRPG